MFNLVSLLIAAALVSQQCSFEATARQIGDKKKVEFDNSLQPNVIPKPRSGWFISHNVKFDQAPPENIRHVIGTTTLVKCGAIGYPSPTIVWMKNGEVVTDFEEEANEIQYINPLSFARLVTQLVLTTPSNGDVYTCVATSGVKQRSASTTVMTVEGEDTADVLEQLFDVPAKPIITAYYADVMQEFESSILLPCRVSSLTEAKIYWTDTNNKPIYDGPHARTLPSGDLFISKLTWRDLGELTCTAKNMYGKESVKTFLYPIKPTKGK